MSEAQAQQQPIISTRSSTPVQKRNIAVLGKTGAGKSTVANKILEGNLEGAANFRVSHSVISSVTEGTTASTALLDTTNGKYLVQVVDTQGLFDTRQEIPNDKIMREIKKFSKDKIPEGFSLILFVFKHGRWTDEEQRTLDYIVSHFEREISAISALIITGCESFTDEEKKRIVDEFRHAQPQIANFMQKGIHTIGFPDISTLKSPFRETSPADQIIDQERIRNLVYSCHEMKLTREIVQEKFWQKVYDGCNIL